VFTFFFISNNNNNNKRTILREGVRKSGWLSLEKQVMTCIYSQAKGWLEADFYRVNLLEKTQLSKPPQLGSDVRPKRLIKEFLYEIQTILRSQYIVYRLGQRGYETLLAHELLGVLSFLNKFNAWIPDKSCHIN